MRYHSEKPETAGQAYGRRYFCNHPVYGRCTLFKMGRRGIAVIQQRYSKIRKSTWWTDIDPWLSNIIFLNPGFNEYFEQRAREPSMDGLYPTVTVRQIMWALKIKPLKKERWETVFDRREI